MATLASSSSEEMEAELQERVESSQKQADHVVEIYEHLKSTVDQLKAELDSGARRFKWRHNGQGSRLFISLVAPTCDSVFLFLFEYTDNN